MRCKELHELIRETIQTGAEEKWEDDDTADLIEDRIGDHSLECDCLQPTAISHRVMVYQTKATTLYNSYYCPCCKTGHQGHVWGSNVVSFRCKCGKLLKVDGYSQKGVVKEGDAKVRAMESMRVPANLIPPAYAGWSGVDSGSVTTVHLIVKLNQALEDALETHHILREECSVLSHKLKMAEAGGRVANEALRAAHIEANRLLDELYGEKEVKPSK